MRGWGRWRQGGEGGMVWAVESVWAWELPFLWVEEVGARDGGGGGDGVRNGGRLVEMRVGGAGGGGKGAERAGEGWRAVRGKGGGNGGQLLASPGDRNERSWKVLLSRASLFNSKVASRADMKKYRKLLRLLCVASCQNPQRANLKQIQNSQALVEVVPMQFQLCTLPHFFLGNKNALLCFIWVSAGRSDTGQSQLMEAMRSKYGEFYCSTLKPRAGIVLVILDCYISNGDCLNIQGTSQQAACRVYTFALEVGKKKLVVVLVAGANSKTRGSLMTQLSNGSIYGFREKHQWTRQKNCLCWFMSTNMRRLSLMLCKEVMFGSSPGYALRLVVDPTKELSMLVYEHKYEEAFTYALQRVMFGSSPGYAIRCLQNWEWGIDECKCAAYDVKAALSTSDKSCGSLWSISSNGKGSVYKVDPPVWNPNVIIPDET
ncbi:hypothetical protein Tco_0443568 [Tanacetum coccineum]